MGKELVRAMAHSHRSERVPRSGSRTECSRSRALPRDTHGTYRMRRQLAGHPHFPWNSSERSRRVRPLGGHQRAVQLVVALRRRALLGNQWFVAEESLVELDRRSTGPEGGSGIGPPPERYTMNWQSGHIAGAGDARCPFVDTKPMPIAEYVRSPRCLLQARMLAAGLSGAVSLAVEDEAHQRYRAPVIGRRARR